MNIARIESEALSLPPEERATLAHRLLLSLEDISEPDFDRLWGEESARRAAEADADKVQAAKGRGCRPQSPLPASVKYSFLPDAEAEYMDAVRVFEQRRAGLGAALIGEFERVIELVAERPESWKPVHPSGIWRIGWHGFRMPCSIVCCPAAIPKSPPAPIIDGDRAIGFGASMREGATIDGDRP